MISNKKIIDFSMLYPDSLRPLQSWRRLIECRSYENFSQKDVYGYEIEYVENCILGNVSKEDINQKQMLTLKYLESLDSWKRQVYIKN